MNQMIKFIENVSAVQLMDIIIAIGIILLFRIFSGTISYIIIRMFKIKEKNLKSSILTGPHHTFRVFLFVVSDSHLQKAKKKIHMEICSLW